MNDIDVPVVIAGGSGSRLWPLSRAQYPKQFLSLFDNASLLQQTLTRITSTLENITAPLIVCNHEHRFIVAEQCRELGITPLAIILEPEGRNTAAAIALAAEYVVQRYNNPNLWVLPADHVMDAGVSLHDDFLKAEAAVNDEMLVTFGVPVKRPSTAFGYIKVHNDQKAAAGWFPIDRFVEKPSVERASEYQASGDYYWNSGMFAFNAKVYLRELKRHASMIYQSCHDAMANPSIDTEFVRPDEAAFVLCPATSVDYAILEKTDNSAMVPLSVSWSDVGSWDSLMDEHKKDKSGNVIQGDVLLHDVSSSFVRSEDRLVSVVGLDDVVVVETADAVLVANKNKSQDVKHIVAMLKSLRRGEASEHVKVFRPWGSYQRIDEGSNYKVKRITVNPGHALSLQRHKYRSEHWVVVQGEATVTNADKEFVLTKDKSTYIPAGAKHRLSNKGGDLLEIIEVQTGTYLGEDDIERYSDRYGRVEKV
jgi:mannose-1-phosphate guanylyltransferase/mannose-6-phosphate isomerase